MFNREFCFC